MIILDTAALLYWTLDPAKLSIKARQAIEQAGRILISSISVWEIALKVKRGKLVLPLSIPDYVERLQRLDMLEIAPVDVQTWIENVNLPWEHRDPADRTIVALAARLGCPIVTSDGIIGEYYQEIIW